MRRCLPAALVVLALSPSWAARADDFDHYTNKVLEKAPDAQGVIKVAKLTPALLAEHGGVLKGTVGALVIVKTNEGRWAKFMASPAKQKINDEKAVPVLLIDRFITYKEDEERVILAQGKNLRLFGGFQFDLDIGQVVPADIGGDVRFIATEMGIYAEPIGKAEIYLVTKPMPDAKPEVAAKVVIGDKFQPQYYAGIYKLHDDGRRSGTLHLTVRDDGVVVGHYFSDKDGKKYEVNGKVGDPHHKIQFKIYYPQTTQQFNGWMFTGDGKAFAGWTRLENQEAGFYAVRVE